jgi:hypothetical protein
LAASFMVWSGLAIRTSLVMQSHILMGNLPLDVASPPIENAMASRTVPVGDPENPNFTDLAPSA